MKFDDRKDYTHRKMRIYTYLTTIRSFSGDFNLRTMKLQTVYNLEAYKSEKAAIWHLEADNPGVLKSDESIIAFDLLQVKEISCKMTLRQFYETATKGE